MGEADLELSSTDSKLHHCTLLIFMEHYIALYGVLEFTLFRNRSRSHYRSIAKCYLSQTVGDELDAIEVGRSLAYLLILYRHAVCEMVLDFPRKRGPVMLGGR